MTKVKMTTLAAVMLGMGMSATAVMADDKDAGAKGSSIVIDDPMPRRPAGSTSGSGDTVEANCPADPSGNAWQGAAATLQIKQKGSGSSVEVEVEHAVPNTLFTVWLRVQGGAGWNRDVNDNQGSPLTGGGATPLAPSTALDDLNAISPWVDPAGAGSSANSFTTDENGNGEFEVDLDFPVIGGAYPFQTATTSRPGFELVPKVAHAIPTPATSSGTPFLIRVISHCTDQSSHGLSPATREAWFQYP
jgi:hypothetical protein